MSRSKFLFRILKLPPQFMYKIGLGAIFGQIVLLLTTTGRKSGKKRVTPLQYEEIDGAIYVAAALGVKADWVRNIIADPMVDVQVKKDKFSGRAELVMDAGMIADFLEVRLERHPVMMKAIMQREGLLENYTRADLEHYAMKRAMVIIRPEAQ